MRYDYVCNSCSDDNNMLCFEVSHGMNKKPKVRCPKCNDINTEKVFLAIPVVYTKGYGWLDVRGRRVDMNLWKLQNDDPYGQYRQPGEKADLIGNLKKKGKHQKNPKTFYVKK